MKYLILIFFIFYFQDLYGFEKKDLLYGVYADYGINLLNVEFGALPTVPNCCNEFDGGSGFAYGIGGVVYYKLNMLHPKLKVGTRLVYYNSNFYMSLL